MINIGDSQESVRNPFGWKTLDSNLFAINGLLETHKTYLPGISTLAKKGG
jgi:hypothetical protein